MLGFRSHNVCEDSRAGKRRDKITDSSLICPTTGAQARCIHQQERWELKISREYCPALCIGIGHISHRWKLECIQQLITFMYISVVPLFSCLLSEVRMSDGALPCHWSSTPGQQVFELANSWLESFIWLLNLLQAWYCSCGRRHSTLSLVLEGFKVKGKFGEEERRITNTGIKQ